jgi:hypothetical protein
VAVPLPRSTPRVSGTFPLIKVLFFNTIFLTISIGAGSKLLPRPFDHQHEDNPYQSNTLTPPFIGLGLGLRLGLAVSGGGEDPPNVPTHAIGTGTGTTGPIGPNRSNSNADTTGDASDGGLGSTGVAAGSEGTADDVRAYDGTNLASSMSTESRFVAMGLAPLVASPLAMGPTPLVSESVNQ